MAEKNKPSTHTEEEEQDLSDRIRESDAFQWLIDNRKVIPYAFIALIAIIAIAFKFTSGRASRAESDYILAEKYFNSLSRFLQEDPDSPNLSDPLDKLKKITDEYPALQSRYDGPIAQLLIAMEKPDQAKEFANRCLERTKADNLPLFHDFAATTLLVSEGNLSEALKHSRSLKKRILESTHFQEMEKQEAPLARLFVYNLLRIAMLEKEAGSPEGERNAWSDWNTYNDMENAPQLAEAFRTIEQELKHGALSINDYVVHREQILQG